MGIVLWLISGLLAAAFLAAGMTKLVQPTEKLAASGMGWVEQTPVAGVRGIGPLMLGAAVIRARRGESRAIGVNVALLVLAAVVVRGRFGFYAF